MSTIFTLEKIYHAYNECKKGKKNTANALKFEMDREKNLVGLLNDLKSHEYEISRHICFITVHPTVREIFAADFRDRIVHHLLYKEIYTIFDATFIEYSYANRIGKGTHNGVSQLRKNIKKVKYENGTGYYLKLDIQSFFRSIDKDILYKMIEEHIVGSSERDSEWTNDILWLTKKIIFHNPIKNFIYKGNLFLRELVPRQKSLFYSCGDGLPIGNLTSQFFANIYLNQLDHFIMEDLGFDNYVRHVDDFIIINENQHKLQQLILVIGNFLQKRLRLKIHPRKIYLQNTQKGIDFLGYFVMPSHVLVRQKVVRRFKNKLSQNINDDGFLSTSQIPMIHSYLGHLSHANSFNLKKHLTG